MIARRKNGKPELSRQASVEEVVQDVIDALKNFPDFPKLATLNFLRDGLFNLQHYVETDGAIGWKDPFVLLEYDIKLAEGEDVPEVIADREVILKLALERLPRNYEVALLFMLTRGIEVHLIEPYTDANGKAHNARFVFPPDVEAEIQALPEDQREDKLAELAEGHNFSGLGVSGTIDEPTGQLTFAADLIFNIRPLTIDTLQGRVFFPIIVGLAFTEGDPSTWSEEMQKGFWQHIFKYLNDQANTILKQAEAEGLPKPKRLKMPKPNRIGRVLPEYFKTPGRLFDTPRHAAVRQKDLPAIGNWYMQTAFTRTVGMAAAALTNTKTRDDILGWQSATVAEVEDLVFCRAEEGTPAHGQHREDILKAFEALRAIPVPIVRIDWKQIGSSRHPRFVKEYKLRIASMLQSYGAVFVDRKTGKKVPTADPVRKKDLVKSKADRRKGTRTLVEMNPADSILRMFPPDRYKLAGFEWRWNTDVAEDFICPEVALDQKNRPRLKQKKGRHHEGSRFINLNRRYFAVQKHLREARSVYATRLLDLIVSEKADIKGRGQGAVRIEIEAAKVIKYLGLWDEGQMRFEQGKLVGVSRVLEERIAPAIQLLIDEKVILPGSDTRPRKDRNPDRRKGPYYRWKVAELFSTVALVPEDEAKVIEAEIIAKAEAEEQAKADPPPPEPPKPVQGVLPGMELPPAPPVPSGADIRAAREAAGTNLRDFARQMGGPSFKTWSLIETGQRSPRSGRIPEDVWQRVRDFVAQHKPKDDPDSGKAGS